jgi:hypothetical protein
MRRPIALAGTVLLGVLLGALLVEASLRIAAAVADLAGATARPAATADGRPVVLFVGDSHVFGLYVENNETLPARAAEVSARVSPPGFLSVNRGRPGATTWVALEEVVESIPIHRPVAVVVLVGINNRSSVVPESAGWYESLRLVRLARSFLANLGEEELRKAQAPRRYRFELGHQPRDGPPRRVEIEAATGWQDYPKLVQPRLRQDLVEIARQARRAGAKTFFLSYFDDYFAFAEFNADLAWAARETSSEFVDMASLGKQALQVRPRGDLLFFDHHTTPITYELEARELIGAMCRAGVLSGKLEVAPLEWLSRAAGQRRPSLRMAPGETLAFAVEWEPGRNGKIVLGAPGAMLLYGWQELPIQDDSVSVLARRDPGLSFTTGDDGTARVEVPAEVRSVLPAQARAVAVMGIGDEGAKLRLFVSDPVDFAPPEVPSAR